VRGDPGVCQNTSAGLSQAVLEERLPLWVESVVWSDEARVNLEERSGQLRHLIETRNASASTPGLPLGKGRWPRSRAGVPPRPSQTVMFPPGT